MRRFLATMPVLLVVLLAFASAATAQAVRRVAHVGMLCPPSCAPAPITNALSDELRKLGWLEGTTIVIERKEAGGRFDRLPALAADLVRSKPDLIVAFAPQPVRAVKEATSEIPIVMLFVADPVGMGLASSLAHPGGNLTGVATLVGAISWERRLAFFENSCHRQSAWQLSSILQTRVHRLVFRGKHHLRPPRSAFSSTLSRCAKPRKFLAQLPPPKPRGAEALYIAGDPIFNSPPNRVPELAAQAGLPSIYLVRAACASRRINFLRP